ncbi:hypothetical protein EYR40_009276 [Pleurotus pulmonarius]|nr:hypothetical protein EYR36_005353 [Pleurotus pulmonarius]KAF4590331.1 hypothetical protein EYR38_009630 [Pleurotus pulmonarius]KAF4590680.1 hypothetical protein EYR40_009276 [Pleurotus pulmonarius]
MVSSSKWANPNVTSEIQPGHPQFHDYEPNVVTISHKGVASTISVPIPWVSRITMGPIGQLEVAGQHDAYPAASFTSALPFEEPTMPNSHDDNMLTPSSEVNPIGVHSDVQQGQLAYPVVLQPEEGINARMAPTVVRHTVGTPAMIAASERRRKLPRKPFVCICGTGFTARADLARHRKGSGCPFTK